MLEAAHIDRRVNSVVPSGFTRIHAIGAVVPLDALPCDYLFTITADTGDRPPAVLAGTPAGTRVVVTAMRGKFSGPKLNGTIANVAGGDWVVMRPDGSLKLDVRLVLQTDDGALVFMTYSGIGHRAADGSMNIRTAPL